ncbi:MAG: ATP synthase F0 subunit B [Acidobacteria bacterium]|jgi:F-type H+-transporting ATPase subunit b|nr:ATP synthase F0 subunit B [Acidobacteriota bacterium]
MTKKALFASLGLALASGLGASSGAGPAHVDWFGVFGKVFNSAVLFGGLFLLLRKPLIRMLAQKSSGIRDDIVAREENLAATELRLREIRERLARVAAEIDTIKSSADAAGKDEMARLEAAGRLEAERIIAMSEEEIRQHVDAAVRTVRERIADLAIERFRDDFGRSLDAATQQKIIERNIDACADLSKQEAGRPVGERNEGK